MSAEQPPDDRPDSHDSQNARPARALGRRGVLATALGVPSPPRPPRRRPAPARKTLPGPRTASTRGGPATNSPRSGSAWAAGDDLPGLHGQAPRRSTYRGSTVYVQRTVDRPLTMEFVTRTAIARDS